VPEGIIRPSVQLYRASLIKRRDAVSSDYLTAFTIGPVALADPSEGLLVRPWRVRMEGTSVWLARGAETGWEPEALLFELPEDDGQEIDIAFTQNGDPAVCVQRPGVGGAPEIWLYWFSPLVSGYTFEKFSAGWSPRILLDDPTFVFDSDVLLFYMTPGGVEMRQQRDMYGVVFNVPGSGWAIIEPGPEGGYGMVGEEQTIDPARSYLEDVALSRDSRVVILASARNVEAGTYRLLVRESAPYPVRDWDAAAVDHRVDSILAETMTISYEDGEPDELSVSHVVDSVEVRELVEELVALDEIHAEAVPGTLTRTSSGLLYTADFGSLPDGPVPAEWTALEGTWGVHDGNLAVWKATIGERIMLSSVGTLTGEHATGLVLDDVGHGRLLMRYNAVADSGYVASAGSVVLLQMHTMLERRDAGVLTGLASRDTSLRKVVVDNGRQLAWGQHVDGIEASDTTYGPGQLGVMIGSAPDGPGHDYWYPVLERISVASSNRITVTGLPVGHYIVARGLGAAASMALRNSGGVAVVEILFGSVANIVLEVRDQNDTAIAVVEDAVCGDEWAFAQVAPPDPVRTTINHWIDSFVKEELVIAMVADPEPLSVTHKVDAALWERAAIGHEHQPPEPLAVTHKIDSFHKEAI
jgi:hypothetical protein